MSVSENYKTNPKKASKGSITANTVKRSNLADRTVLFFYKTIKMLFDVKV